MQAVVSGWGALREGGDLAETLQKVFDNIFLQDSVYCAKFYFSNYSLMTYISYPGKIAQNLAWKKVWFVQEILEVVRTLVLWVFEYLLGLSGMFNIQLLFD